MIDVFDKRHTITKKIGGWELANVPRQYSNVLRTETQKMFLKDENYIFFALKKFMVSSQTLGMVGVTRNTHTFCFGLKALKKISK